MADVKVAPLTTTPPTNAGEWGKLLLAVGITAAVVFVVAFAAGKGWKKA